MANRWAIVIPSAQEVNLLPNPSFEKDTTVWTAVGATLTRDVTVQRRGLAALKLAPTSGVNDGAYTTVTTTAAPYGFGIDVLGAAGVPYLIRWADTSGNLLGTAVTFTGTGKWQRLWVGYTDPTGTTRRLYVSKNNHASTANFWVDGALCSQVSAETTYFDGDTVGFYAGDYFWANTPHNSQSVRKGYIRHGGRIGEFESEFGFYTEAVMGFGLSRIVNILLPLALLGGATFQRQVSQDRVGALVGTFVGDTMSKLQQNRQRMISAVAPAAYGRDEPFMLLYRSGDGTAGNLFLEIPALYGGGLEGGVIRGLAEKSTLQFQMYLPYVTSQGNQAGALSVLVSSAPSGSGLLRRDVDGVWKGNVGTGTVKGAAIGPDGYLYPYGTFTNLGSVTNASGIAKYDPATGTITALGTGIPTSSVNCAKFGPDGNLYVTGNFNGAGGVATTRGLARWNMGTQAWESIGEIDIVAGNEPVGMSLDWDTTGKMWLAGTFGTVGSVANTRKIAYYDGTWHAAGSGATGAGTSDSLLHVISDRKGGVYVYGRVSNVGGVSNTSTFAHWTGSAWESLGAATTTQYDSERQTQGDRMLVFGDDGKLYLPNYVCDGKSLTAFASPSFYSPFIMFKYRGGLAFPGKTTSPIKDGYAGSLWNGSNYEYLTDIYNSNTPFLVGLLDYNGVTYAFTKTNSPTRSGGSVTVNNTSTSPVYPKFVITGYGRLFAIRNLTTGKRIGFNLVLQAGQVATLDLTPGSLSFSDAAGNNLMGTIIPGTDYQSFTLVPGTNVIAAHVNNEDGVGGSVTSTISMIWRENHIAIDGGSN